MSKSRKRQWEFKPKFRARLYSWNGSAKATKNLRAGGGNVAEQGVISLKALWVNIHYPHGGPRRHRRQ